MSPLDEQEQINQLRIDFQDLHDELHDITILLLGDKLKDPDARSLIDDIKENNKFRLIISKRVNWARGIAAASLIGLIIKTFWASFMKLISSGGPP